MENNKQYIIPQYMSNEYYPQQNPIQNEQYVSYPAPNNATIQIIYVDRWNSELFTCYKDCGICFSTLCCCTCQTFNIKQDLHNGTKTFLDYMCQICLCPFTYSGLWCCQGWYESNNRIDIKVKMNFMDDNPDICESICCLPCVICQHKREMKYKKYINN